MKISEVIKLLEELKDGIGGDPKLLTGDKRPLKEEDFSVQIMMDKSGDTFYSVYIRSGEIIGGDDLLADDEPLNKHEFYDDDVSYIRTDYTRNWINLKTPGDCGKSKRPDWSHGDYEEIFLSIDDIGAMANQLGFGVVSI